MKPDIAMLKIRRRSIARNIAERTGGTKGSAALGKIDAATGCDGKERFVSFAMADKVRARKQKGPRAVYACRDCGGFHIGGNRGQREQRA